MALVSVPTFFLTSTAIVLPKKSPEPFPQERAALDQELSRIETLGRNLRSQRNELSTICRLPIEILAHIFTLHSQSSSFYHHGLSQYHSPYNDYVRLSWFQITHVCRHFRLVALGCPSLWTYLDFSSRSWTEEMFSRSKSADLVLSVSRPTAMDLVKIVLKEIHRVKEIRFSSLHTSHIEQLLQGLDGEAPKLQTLAIVPIGGRSYGLDSVLPPKLFSGGTPQLKHLHLTECHIPWSHGIPDLLMSNLTSLALVEYHRADHNTPTPVQLLDVLGNMPGLRTLELENTLPIVHEDIKDIHFSDRMIALPELDSMSLRGPTKGSIILLHSLTIPGSTKIKIFGQSTTDVQSETTALALVLSKCRSVVVEPQGMRLECFSPVSIQLSLWDSVPGEALPIRDARSLEIEITHIISEFTVALIPDIPGRIFNVLLDSLQLKQLRALDMTEFPGLDETTYRTHFGNLPFLRTIKVVGQGGQGLLEALVPSVTTGSRSHVHSNLAFPSLASLCLESLSFEGTDNPDFQPGLQLDVLEDALQLRAEYGAAIRDLSLHYVRRFYKQDAAALRHLVFNLEWDGYVLNEDTEDEAEEDPYSDEIDMYLGGPFLDVYHDPFAEDDDFPLSP